jgi:hypothetical protein
MVLGTRRLCAHPEADAILQPDNSGGSIRRGGIPRSRAAPKTIYQQMM